MTIERQVDFLGKFVRRTRVIPGFKETLEEVTPFVQGNPSKTRHIGVEVLDGDTLDYIQGHYTGLGRRLGGNLWELQGKGTKTMLTKGRINEYDIHVRKWWGGRVSYKWKPSPDDLDLL